MVLNQLATSYVKSSYNLQQIAVIRLENKTVILLQLDSILQQPHVLYGDEYTRHRLLIATHFRYRLFREVATASWLKVSWRL